MRYTTKRPPFPTDVALRRLLETVYQGSLLTEEGRRLTLHITYVTPAFFDRTDNYIDTRTIPFRLTSPRAFTIKELLRISPAIDPWSASLLVCDQADLDPTAQPGLVLWGILNMRSNWAREVAGEHSARYGRPGLLTVTSSRPGRVVVNAGWQPFAILVDGEIRTGRNVALRLVDLMRPLRAPIEALDHAVARCFSLDRLPRDNMHVHWSEYHYIDALQRLLFLAAQDGHGACFLFLPGELVSVAISTDQLNVKYPLSLPSLSQALVRRAARYVRDMAHGGYGHLSILRDVEPHFDDTLLKNPIVAGDRNDPIDDPLEDCWRIIARLSQVDGAVLLTDQLDCIGFGCEIRVPDEPPVLLKHATGPARKYVRNVPIEGYGTRHRSAFRFCNAFPGAFALIVSQDGEAKLSTKVGADVVFWTVSPSGLFLE